MVGFLGKRMLWSAGALIGLVIVVFFTARLTGSPADLYLPIDALNEMRVQLGHLHGFDRPLWQQFASSPGSLLALGFGNSLRQGLPAIDLVPATLPTTLLLAFWSIGIALIGGAVAVAAWRPNGSPHCCH